MVQASSSGQARWSRLQDAFHCAEGLPDAERRAFVERLREDDPELGAELVRLLEFAARDVELDAPIRAVAESAADSLGDDDRGGAADGGGDVAPQRLGPYEIVRRIAAGGMGEVYLARRADDEFDQQVAIKRLARHFVTPTMLARLRGERQILAQLDHPNICRLLDGGTDEHGVPYLVMEYIDGEAIDGYCDSRGLGLRARLEMFIKVCGAVEYAHRNLIVHRDIKPSNILVTADGTPKLLDFGIAKLLDDGAATYTVAVTVADVRLLTPAHASPEQIRGEPMTTGSDVYSLGVLLYQLFSGESPYEFKSHRLPEIERVICESEPARPSTKSARWRRELRGDLDNIVLKAMRKQPEDRYASAAQFAEDVERYLNQLPVRANAGNRAYHARKFVARNRRLLGATAAVLLSVTGLVGFYTAELASERDVARQERDAAGQVSDFLVELFETSEPERARATTLTTRQLLDRGAERISGSIAEAPDVRARLMTTLGRVYYELGDYGEARRLVNQALELNPARGLDRADALLVSSEIALAGETYRVAESAFVEGLSIYEEELGETAPRTLAVQVDHGNLLAAGARFDDAIATCERVTKVAPVDSELLSRASRCLGSAYTLKGDYDAAEKVLRDDIELSGRIYGKDSLAVADSQYSLAAIAERRGKLESAVDLVTQALRTKVSILGTDHPDVAELLSFRSLEFYYLNRYDRAEADAEEAIRIIGDRQGEPNTSVGASYLVLGNILLDKGESRAAEKDLRRAVEIVKTVVAPTDMIIAAATNSLGYALEDQGRYEEAEALYEETLERHIAAAGVNHASSIISLSNLGQLLLKMHRPKEAYEKIALATERAVANLGPTHRDTLHIERKLGLALAQNGRFDESLALFEQIYPAYQAAYASQPYQRASFHSYWGESLLLAGRVDAAIEQFDTALKLRVDKFGEDNTDVAETRLDVAEAYLAEGRDAEAREQARTALNAQLAAGRRADHPLVERAREIAEEEQTSDVPHPEADR